MIKKVLDMMESEKIKAFLDFVEESKRFHDFAMESMKKEDKKLQDFLHAIEFEPNAKERSKICTKLHESRMARRSCLERSGRLKSTIKTGSIFRE